MLLPELVNRHKSADGTIHVVADDDFAGFRGLSVTRFQPAGGEPDVDADPATTVRPGDVLLADAAMTSADPWVILDSAPAGVPILVVFANRAADAQVGVIVQSLSEHGLDFVEAQALESVYNRQIAVVGVREGATMEPGMVRRIVWEWSIGTLVTRAQAERQRVTNSEQAKRQRVTNSEQAEVQRVLQARVEELTSARADDAELTADLRSRIDELMGARAGDAETVANLESTIAGSERTLRESRNAPSNRIGEAVLTLPRHPVSGLKGLSAELRASRRRHQNAVTPTTKNRDPR